MTSLRIGAAVCASLLLSAAAPAQTGPAGRDVSQFGPGAAGQRTSQESVYHPQRMQNQPRQRGFDQPTREGAMRGHAGRDMGPMGRGYPDQRQYSVRRRADLNEADQPWRDDARDRWWQQSGDQRLRDYHVPGDRSRVSPRAAAWNEGYGSWTGATEPRDRVRVGRTGEVRPVARADWRESEFQQGRVRVPYGSPTRARGEASRARPAQRQDYQARGFEPPSGQQRMMGAGESRGQFNRDPNSRPRFDRDFDRWFEQEAQDNGGRMQPMRHDRWY